MAGQAELSGECATSKRQQGVIERKQRLVKAASDLIAERENGAFSMPELAKRSGLSLATPYNLFGSKAGVLALVCERLVEGFHRDDTWMDGLPPCERIFGVIDRLVTAYEKQGDLFRNLWKALYGLDIAEHRNLNLSVGARIVNPLVTSLARDALLVEWVPLAAVESTLVRLFDANFEMWAAQDWSPSELRRQLRLGFAMVFVGLLGTSEQAVLKAVIATESSARSEAPAPA